MTTTYTHNDITIDMDLSKDSMYDELGLYMLEEAYMLPHHNSPQERLAHSSIVVASNAEHAQRLYNYASSQWLSYSSPILSYDKTKKGLPISCFLPVLSDTMEDILFTSGETRQMATSGGGVGVGVDMRSVTDVSTGVMAHLKYYDADTIAFKQGKTRRAASAFYMNDNHPEIMRFLEMRKPTGGSPEFKCLNLHHGINLSDDFMERVDVLSSEVVTKAMAEQLDKWHLIDPHTKKVTEVVSVMQMWQKIMELRHETGEPYIHFIDTSNKAMKLYQKNLDLFIKNSNLCVDEATIVEVIELNDLTDNSESKLLTIAEVYDNMQKGIRYSIACMNEYTGDIEFRSIVRAMDNGTSEDIYEIEFNDKTIKVTGDHEMFTTRGWIKAKDLLETDELIDRSCI